MTLDVVFYCVYGCQIAGRHPETVWLPAAVNKQTDHTTSRTAKHWRLEVTPGADSQPFEAARVVEVDAIAAEDSTETEFSTLLTIVQILSLARSLCRGKPGFIETVTANDL